MFLSKTLLAQQVHDAVLKSVSEAPYDIDRINGKTESGGLEMVGEVDQTIATGGTAKVVTAFTGSYQLATVTASTANGTLTTTADLDWDISASGTIRRSGNSSGEVILELFSDNDGVVATQVINRNSNIVTKFDFSVAAEDLTIASVISLRIAGDTVTGEIFKVTDCAVFAESTV